MIDARHVRYLADMRERIATRLFGLEDVSGAVITAMISGGHVLLEGNPGLGKTALVKTLGDVAGFAPSRIGRIQFTPDLMPSDITGTLMPEPTAENPHALAFRPGPLFHWLLLADEINRASPKTQSAMLEAMAERQITVLGETHRLSPPRDLIVGERRYRAAPPFMVLATQNPIDHEGTYDLPEAQADRFMFKIRMPFPRRDVLARIVDKEAGPVSRDAANDSHSTDEKTAICLLHEIALGLRQIELPEPVAQHVLNIVLASNNALDSGGDIATSQSDTLGELVTRYFAYPLGPRAARDLTLGAKGWAIAMLGASERAETGGTTADALARIAAPTLRHRLKLRLGWRRHFEQDFPQFAGLSEAAAHDRLIGELCALAAPQGGDYADMFRQAYDATLAYPL